MINLQEGIDMQTVSRIYYEFSADANMISTVHGSIHVSTLNGSYRASMLTFSSAVHNFCTSQKAVSNSSNGGVIGGAHRGGESTSAGH